MPTRARSIPRSAISILKFKTEIPALWAYVPTMPSIVFWRTWIFTSAPDLREFTMAATSRKTCIFTGASTASGPGSPPRGGNSQLIDATFEGQREAAIREHEAGLTLIRPQFKNVPTAISIDPQYSDELWIKDGRMENVSGPAVIISNENSARTEINMENVVCRKVPVFVAYRESGKHIAGPAEMYEVKTFSHGLHYEDIGSVPAIQDVYETAPLSALPEPVKSDILDLPPIDTWVNIRSLGAKGDGTTDDTDALRKAIAQHRAIYLPSGQYRVTDTITLQAGYGSHRPASERHTDTACRFNPSLSRRWQSQAAARNSKGRDEHRDRHRPLHQRHQSASGGGEVDGRHGFDDERCPLSGRSRHD